MISLFDRQIDRQKTIGKMAVTQVLVAEALGSQMGVSMTLSGEMYWFSFLDDQVAEQEIDEETRIAWETKYDGYKMVWQFTNPNVEAQNGNIDAACILGATKPVVEQTEEAVVYDYSKGGWCVGVEYEGLFQFTPKVWAKWLTDTNFDTLLTAELTDAVSDEANWSEPDNFNTSWEVERWLPKEERSVDYYSNEYRFAKG